jgi:predicted ArsR family transcriptional regulator
MVGNVVPDASAIAVIAVLSEDLRRRIYAFIRRSDHPITRDEAAASVGISRKLAAFHLDKLVEAGLLTARYAKIVSSSAPRQRRVGRAPKVYEPADADIQLSIPQREHGTLAEILLDAVLAAGEAGDAREAALAIAAGRGRRLGVAERAAVRGGRIGAERALTLAFRILEAHGFEPAREGATLVRLRNCPFHPYAARRPELVCAINHAFLAGLVDGLGAVTVAAMPRRAGCCVELGTSQSTSTD